MKIKLVSDLHMEISPYEVINDQNYDVLILSGDIMISQPFHDYPDTTDISEPSKYKMMAWRFRQFLKDCSERFPKVIYVAGNHEFYHGNFYAGLQYLREECDVYPNIFFLENDYVIIDDIAFIGATLWTNCDNLDQLTMYYMKMGMNDYRLITHDKNGYRKLIPEDTVTRHVDSMTYFNRTIKKLKEDGVTKFVMVTHHSPSFMSHDSRFDSNDPLNGAYHSNLSEFILDNPEIVLWTHGHTHESRDYTIGDTRIVCNPRGYDTVGYTEQTGWNPNILIEV